jgi:serine/threonine-protein kinase
MLGRVQSAYLFFGAIVGFAWWLMWIPLCVAVGFEAVLHPNCLYASVVIGVVGLVVSEFLYVKVLKSDNESAEKWRRRLSGNSVTAAHHELDQIESAQIR